MRKFRKIAAGVAALTAAGVGLPAAAQTSVPVNLENPAGSRVLYVEDMTGNGLSSLDFGTQRSLPFRVRVVDSAFARTNFTVNASMSNLYKHSGGTIGDYTKKIPSSDITMGSQLNPVNALDVTAVVQPVVDTLTTLTGTDALLCGTLGIATSVLPGGLGTGCQISTNDLVGKVQSLTVPVTTALGDLPMVPQAPEAGNFPRAEYAVGVGAGDSSGAGAAGDQRKLIGGTKVDSAALLTALTGLVDTNPRQDLIDDATIVAGLSAVNGLVSTLTSSQIATLLTNTVATVNALTGTNILSVSGTYVSLPTLSVTVPAGADPGSYKGTLVVTGIQ